MIDRKFFSLTRGSPSVYDSRGVRTGWSQELVGALICEWIMLEKHGMWQLSGQTLLFI